MLVLRWVWYVVFTRETTQMETTTQMSIEEARAAIKAAGELETECSRCHGTGKHSHCQGYGDTCFRCRGKGRTLSARGAATDAYLKTIRSKCAADLAVGDVIWTEGRGFVKSGWSTVTSVGPSQHRAWSIINGERVEHLGLLDVTTDVQGHGLHGCSAETLFRVFQNPQRSVDTWRQAMAYQASLTKAGKPRNR